MKPRPPEPEIYMKRIMEKMNLEVEVYDESISIFSRARELRMLIGRDPRGMCAAAVYIASRLHGPHISQSAVAAAVEVTVVTVRKRYQELSRKLKIRC